MEISPVWAAEFCGLFWADGNFMIDVLMRTTKGRPCFNARVRARITQRHDNRALLEHIQSVLGGHVTRHKEAQHRKLASGAQYTSHPNDVWQVQGADDVERVLDLLERYGTFPARKAREIPIMREAIALKRARRYRYTDEQRAHFYELKERLIELRHYDGC